MSFYSDFAEHYEAVFPFREAVLAFVLARLPADPARVLDLGCGPGHYAGRLAALGHEAVGVDLDPQMIAAARRRYPAATFLCRDMAELDDLVEGFDLAFCLGNVAAHLPPERVPVLLGGLARLLRPGGAWLLQTVNWDAILGRPDHRFPDRELPGGLVFRREYRDVSPTRLRFRTRLSRHGRTLFAGEVALYPVKAGDYRRRHEAAGFACQEHLAGYDGAPFEPRTAPASILVFRREG